MSRPIGICAPLFLRQGKRGWETDGGTQSYSGGQSRDIRSNRRHPCDDFVSFQILLLWKECLPWLEILCSKSLNSLLNASCGNVACEEVWLKIAKGQPHEVRPAARYMPNTGRCCKYKFLYGSWRRRLIEDRSSTQFPERKLIVTLLVELKKGGIDEQGWSLDKRDFWDFKGSLHASDEIIKYESHYFKSISIFLGSGLSGTIPHVCRYFL